MTMQLKGDPFNGMVSKKGLQRLEQIAHDAANRARCVEAASKRITEENPNRAAWLVLHVWPGREQAVEKALADCDIDACTPLCKGPKRRRHHKELPPSDKPVFMGYTFVRCIPSDYAMQGLSGFDHVRGIVGGWSKPFKVNDENINRFRILAAEGAYDWEVPCAALPKGCKVRVTEGPFETFEGIVVAFGGAGKGTPVVELDIFGRKTPILIPLAMLSRL